jgi:hypothetical protein
VEWSCESLFRGESYGWEARVFTAGKLFVSPRFVLRAQARRWADEQKNEIERGWVD